MFYRSYTPAPPLGDFIERFWLCSDAPPHRRERILPSGTIELVINLHEDEIRIYSSHSDRCTRMSGAVLSGAYSRFFVIDPLQHASILGVHFKPGGAFPFLGLPAGELADTHVDVETLWGRSSAAELRERLCAAATPAERFSLMEGALLSRLRHPSKRHGAVPAALDAFGRSVELRIRDVAGRVGLSQRRFIQVFAAEVGLTPKLYSRVQRFQQALALARKAAAPDWARVAVDCGYYDQSHLIRDFLAFSGLTPADYVRRQSEDVLPNHIPQTR